LFELGDVRPAAVQRDGAAARLDVHDLGPELGGLQLVVMTAPVWASAGEGDAVDDELLAVAGGLRGGQQPSAPVAAGVDGGDERGAAAG
jgi:hypothetical protein